MVVAVQIPIDRKRTAALRQTLRKNDIVSSPPKSEAIRFTLYGLTVIYDLRSSQSRRESQKRRSP
jgi:hypothetical protein